MADFIQGLLSDMKNNLDEPSFDEDRFKLPFGNENEGIFTNEFRGNSIQTHLSMPIVPDDVNFLLENEVFHCPRHIEMHKVKKKLQVKHDIYEATNNDPYPFLTTLVKKTKLPLTSKELRKEMLENIDIAIDSMYVHKGEFINDEVTTPGKLKLEKDQVKNRISGYTDILFEFFQDMKKSEKVKDDICYKKIPFGSLIHYGDILKIERDIFFCKINNEWVIGPTNLFLCNLDIMQSRFPKVFYWVLADITDKYPSSMLEAGLHIINEMEYLRSNLGEDFFSVIGNWESLVLGSIIKDQQQDLGFQDLYTTAENDIKEIFKLHNLEYDLKKLLPPTDDVDMLKKHIEMLGNTKHFGHPYIDIVSGMENVKNFGTEEAFVDIDIAKEAAAIFTRDFIKEFIIKKRRWPNCKRVPSTLLRHYKMGIYPISLREDYQSWGEIEFDKNFDYDYSPDTTELIKDSSAAQVYSNWTEDYDRCAFCIKYNQKKPSTNRDKKPTRVIQRFLQGDEDELKKKIEEVERGYYDPDDDMAVFCRKEQELKKKGRLFVKQTYRQRLLQTSMENNISKQIMKFVPEQTMTNGEIQLMRRLANAAKDQKTKTEILNLDLSKWNMRFRHALVCWFGAILDKLFGFKRLYRDNHIWFLRAKVFINSRLAPPPIGPNGEPEECDFFYLGHLGGMEGMRQKLWTIITICLIKLAAERLGLKISIMCQGDNQVVMIKYNTEDREKRKEIRSEFLDVLSNILLSVNLVLKREETWFSIRLCEFGKVRYIDGEAISNCDKKINRCIPDINDGICSFMSGLSTINTITEATAKYDYTPDRTFILNQFMILNYLKRRGVLKNRTRIEQMSLLYHPSDFGGISLSTYCSHFVRGYDDKVTLWLNIIKKLKIEHPSVYAVTLKLNQFEPISGEINHAKLVEDIFSLNVRNLPSIEHFIRDKALDYLMSDNVTNPEVTKLFKSGELTTKDYLVKELITMEPFIPSLAHEILRNSNIGILLALRNRFTNISTITRVIQNEVDESSNSFVDFLEMTRLNNDKVIKILISKFDRKPNYFIEDYLSLPCMTKASEELRRIHWGLNIIGASKPYPVCQFYLKPLDLCTPEEIRSSITIQLSSTYSTMNSVNYLRDGPYISYLGSATRDKVIKPSLSIQSKTSHTKALQHLILIKSWAIKEGAHNLLKLVNMLIGEKEDLVSKELLEMEEDEWCAVNYGGNIFHRFRSMLERDSAVVNFTTTVGTHFIQSTNNLAGITSGGKDYTIHFQLVLIMNIARLMLIKETNWINYSQFCAVLSCGGCTKEVTGVKFDLTNAPQIQNLDIDQPRELLPVLERTFNCNELNFLLSIYLGKLFGSSVDTMFSAICKSDKVNSDTINIASITKISINDLRYVHWDYLMVGMIKNSRTLREAIYFMNDAHTLFQKTKIFAPFCTFLINGGLLENFFSHFHIIVKEHYQAIDPNKVSELMMPSLLRWFKENRDWAMWTCMQQYFLEEDLFVIINNIKWVRGMLYKSLNSEERHILKRLKVNMTNFRYCSKLCEKYLDDYDRFHYNPCFREDELIIHVRYAMKNDRINKIINTSKITLTPTYSPPDIKTYSTLFIKNTVRLYRELLNEKPCEATILIPEVQHLNRHIGLISTGASKIADLLTIFDLYKIQVKNVYCLAEGSGSILEFLGTVYPFADLFYNTLLTPEVDKRMSVDQNYPPSVLSSDKVNINRIHKNNTLSMGITDITTPQFLEKIEAHFIRYPPSVITMDAESMTQGNNSTIIMLYVPLIKKYNCMFSFFKTYNITDGLEIKSILTPYLNDYNIWSIKPPSSNPNNREFYVCIVNKSIKLDTTMLDLLEDYSLKLFSIFPLSQLYDLIHYINFAKTNFLQMKHYLPKVSFPEDYLGEFFQNDLDKKYCNIRCPKFHFKLLIVLDEVDTMTLDKEYLFLIIREGGTLGNYNRICSILIYGIMLKLLPAEQAVLFLASRDLDFELRTGDSCDRYRMSDFSQDWKTFLRRITSYEITKPCKCKITNSEFNQVQKFRCTKMLEIAISEISGLWFKFSDIFV